MTDVTLKRHARFAVDPAYREHWQAMRRKHVATYKQKRSHNREKAREDMQQLYLHLLNTGGTD